MTKEKMSGVIAPILTPFNDDLSFAADLYLPHAQWLLQNGIHYISPFGTTGEALSLSVEERLSALDSLIDGGIDPGVLMPGTGLCNLPETIKLCRHSAEHGCAAVMTLPPFFFKNATDDGIYVYFERLIEAVDHPGFKICLYHIPPMAVVGFSPNLAAQLAQDFPDVVVAYKDSSGDFENTKAVIAAVPSIAVFPGSETFLRKGVEYGGVGCISATCNINPLGIRKVYDVATGTVEGDLDQVNHDMVALRKMVEGYAPILAMKGLLAQHRREPRWRNVRPPLLPVTENATQELISALDNRLGNLSL